MRTHVPCGESVPSSLCGALKVVKRCALDADHRSDHRVSQRVDGIGKVVYTWKRATQRAAPVVDLPVPEATQFVGMVRGSGEM